uniref:ORF2 protein n=1 Tax=Lucheng Rn rat coronavirus TaxID=1508224 RepID=A0A866VZY4_9ALPC|nr:ORF2 protein [Lucheng Rn rat coronavirus]
MAFADNPTHFVNVPLKCFEDFYEQFVLIQRELVSKLDCKIQNTPHVSLTMLDARNSELKYIDFAIRDCIDYMYAGKVKIRFSNIHLLGKHIIADVSGLQNWHDKVEDYIKNAGYVCGQSRPWLPHLTIASLECSDEDEFNRSKSIFEESQFGFEFELVIRKGDSFYLEIVKIGAPKHDGYYDEEFSAWVYDRLSDEPPTHKLGTIMDYSCLECVIIEMEPGDFPDDERDAWYKLQYSYEDNGWFWRYCLSRSKTFRRHIHARACTCFEYTDSDSD